MLVYVIGLLYTFSCAQCAWHHWHWQDLHEACDLHMSPDIEPQVQASMPSQVLRLGSCAGHKLMFVFPVQIAFPCILNLRTQDPELY